jgi:hypothetical protein
MERAFYFEVPALPTAAIFPRPLQRDITEAHRTQTSLLVQEDYSTHSLPPPGEAFVSSCLRAGFHTGNSNAVHAPGEE